MHCSVAGHEMMERTFVVPGIDTVQLSLHHIRLLAGRACACAQNELMTHDYRCHLTVSSLKQVLWSRCSNAICKQQREQTGAHVSKVHLGWLQ
jgi:hypothetical protein